MSTSSKYWALQALTAFLFWLQVVSPAQTQERCFQEGAPACILRGSGWVTYKCEKYPWGLGLTQVGTPCDPASLQGTTPNFSPSGDISGTWIGTQNCSGEIDDLIYEFEQTGAGSFIAIWVDGNGNERTFPGTVQGQSVVAGSGEGGTYRLQRSGNRLRGTLTLSGGPPCRVELTKSD